MSLRRRFLPEAIFCLPVKKRWIDDLPKPEELPEAVKTYGDHTGRTARDEEFAQNIKDAAGKVKDAATFSASGLLVLLGLYLLATSNHSTGEERPRKRRVRYE